MLVLKILLPLLYCITLVVGNRVKRQGFIDLNKVDRCKTPRGDTGICLNIKQCNTLVELLKTQKDKLEVRQYLLQSVCGYEGFDPKVCCQSVTSEQIQTHSATTNTPARVNTLFSSTVPTTTELGRQAPDDEQTVLPEPGECGHSISYLTRVVGGQNATLGAWPWIVALGYKAKRGGRSPVYLCAGTLITDRHVITAGHCVHNRDLYLARLGDLNLYEDNDGASPINIPIKSKKIHENYSPSTFVNDIALLTLDRRVKFTNLIKPICLPTSREMRGMDFVNRQPFLAGWGSVSYNGPSSANLLQLQLPVVKESDCKKAFTKFSTAIIDERVVCAGFARGGKDACRGDSGGPLMDIHGKYFYLIGVVSYGYKCAEPGYPGVYTRVTSFSDWIINNINK